METGRSSRRSLGLATELDRSPGSCRRSTSAQQEEQGAAFRSLVTQPCLSLGRSGPILPVPQQLGADHQHEQVQQEIELRRRWTRGCEGVGVQRVALSVGLGVQPSDRAVVVKGAGFVQRSSAAPNLFHFPRQRDRVGRIVSVGI